MSCRWIGAAATLLLAACGGIGNGSRPNHPDGSLPPPQPAPPEQPAPPQPPLITAQSFAATEDADFSATLATLAGANASLMLTANPTSGTLTAFAADGAFTYRPGADFSGVDTFTVEAVTPTNTRATAVITVNVAAVNDEPEATGEIFEIPAAADAVLSVLDNDRDVDDTALVPTLVTTGGPNPEVGSAAVDGSNRIRLSLPADFRGITRVRYRVRDAAGAESAEVTAVAFVGMTQQDLWYVAPGSDSRADLFVTDFLTTRQVTRFTAPRGAGNVIVSADRRTLIVPEREDGNVRALWAVDTSPDAAPVRLTPDHGPGRAIGRYVVSPDGRWVAWLVGDAAQVPELWLADVTAASPRRVEVPSSAVNLETIHLMRFTPDSRALYFGSVSAGGNTALLRMAVDSTAAPNVVYPRAGETGGVTGFFIAPDDTHVIVHDRHLFRVPLDGGPRVRLNAALAAGQSVVAPSTNRDLTRFVYRTTDGRLWSSSLDSPDVSTLLLDRDPARGVPGIEGVRPDGGAALVSIPSTLLPGQVDLAEIPLAAPGVPLLLSPPAAGIASSNRGQYLDDATVFFVERVAAQPARLFEFRRGVPGLVAMGEPGFSGPAVRYSADFELLAFMQASGEGHQGVVVSRAAPAVMVRATPVMPVATGYEVVTLTSRRR